MAVSDFVPLIGSGFDALASQRMGWEQFNANIESQNIARAERAQQQEDNYLAQMQALNEQRDQENFQRQLEADAYTRQQTVRNQDEATRQRERAQDIALGQSQFQKQIDYGKNYLDQQQKIAEEKITAASRNKDLILDAQGQHLAANYQGLVNAKDQTAQALDDLHGQIADVESQLEAERGKKKPDQVKIMGLQAKQKLYNQSLRQREADARGAENKLNALVNHAENARFEINDDGSITHPDSSKTWSWKNVLKQAKAAAADTEDTSAGLPWAGFAPRGTPRAWDAGAQDTGTETTAAPAPPIAPVNPSPFREGQMIRNKTTGQIGRVVNGQIELIGDVNASGQVD